MLPSSNKSEVAQLLWRIEKNCEAMHRIMYDPCFSASHRSINRRYQALGKLEDRLAQHVGERAATDVLYDIYNNVMSQPPTPPSH